MIIAIFCSSILACKDDDSDYSGIGFSSKERSPVVTFTINGEGVRISNTCTGLWTNNDAMNEVGEVFPEKTTKGFGSVLDSGLDGKQQVTVLISKWVTEDDIDAESSTSFDNVVEPAVFRKIFNPGGRNYAVEAYQVTTYDEVNIEYTDENGTRWSTSFMGNFDNRPSHSELQPSSKFSIIRSMPMGKDSVLVEARFKARFYKSEKEYVVVSDGYFKGFFYRKM